MNHENTETMKHVIDLAAGATVVGTLVGWLPSVAAILTIVWTVLRIYDWVRNEIRNG